MPDLKVVLQAGTRPTHFCPVNVQVDLPADDVRERALYDEQKAISTPFQVEACDESSGCVVHWMVESMAPHQRRYYTLTEGKKPAEGTRVNLHENADRVRVETGGEMFTNYHFGEGVPRPVLYPIIGPYGEGVTRAYPMETIENDHTDHPHHRSVWSAWGDVNGSDNWSEEEGAGEVKHRAIESMGSGPVFGWICTTNDWVDRDGNKLLEDESVCRFYNLPHDARLLEMQLTLTASEGEVRLGDTKEGGLCSVRVAAPMEVDRGGHIENAYGGMDEDETWGQRAQWCDYSGVVGGNEVGIAIFDHPDNFRHPTYWHVRNYGLMTANPFGLSYFHDSQDANGAYTLPVGDSMTFNYAVFVHAGDARGGGVGRRYLDWIHPPVASVVQN